MSRVEHERIITRAFRSYDAESTLNSITLNVPILHTCEAQEEGKPCWHHADLEYHTTAFFMDGIYYPNEVRHLCKQCYDRIFHIMLTALYLRVQQEQEGRVA